MPGSLYDLKLSIDELLSNPESKNLTDAELSKEIVDRAKLYLVDGRCQFCGSTKANIELWNSGHGHYTELYVCSSCMTKFAIKNQM